MSNAEAAPSYWHVLIALVALAAIRVVGLYFSVVDLYFDEAQYWAWSRELAFGYFSKPPLLAWIIAGSDLVCGSGEACARVASPVFHLATSLVVYAIARELYDRRIAAWSALVFSLGTGLIFSSRIISTDVPLLFFWAVALLAYVKLVRAANWRWAIAFGVAFGLGMLAKYAMIYFLLGAICAAFVDRDARALLARSQTWVALVISALILAPNAEWNAANNFVTLKHTGDNIAGGGLRFNPSGALEFIESQFAVAGPLVFAAFLILLGRVRDPRIGREDRLMLAFAIPPLALVAAMSFVRDAHANWAAPAILSMTIVVVAWWLRNNHRHALRLTFGIGLTVQALLLAGDAFAYRVTAPMLGDKADLYQRTLGWRGLGVRAGEIARATRAQTIVAEGRAEMAALIYYLRDEPVRVVSWPLSSIPDHHFDLTRALDSSAPEPVLFISSCDAASRFNRFYGDVTPLGSFAVKSGASSARQYHAFRLAQRQRAIEPLGPC